MRSDTLTPSPSPRGRGERALDHRELIHRQPIVHQHIIEIHQPHMIARDAAIRPRIFHRHAIA